MSIRGYCFICKNEILQSQSMVHVKRESTDVNFNVNIKAHRMCEYNIFAERGKKLFDVASKVEHKTKELEKQLKDFYKFE